MEISNLTITPVENQKRFTVEVTGAEKLVGEFIRVTERLDHAKEAHDDVREDVLLEVQDVVTGYNRKKLTPPENIRMLGRSGKCIEATTSYLEKVVPENIVQQLNTSSLPQSAKNELVYSTYEVTLTDDLARTVVAYLKKEGLNDPKYMTVKETTKTTKHAYQVVTNNPELQENVELKSALQELTVPRISVKIKSG